MVSKKTDESMHMRTGMPRRKILHLSAQARNTASNAQGTTMRSAAITSALYVRGIRVQ
jgi:hypothetical protein